ncbi:nuclear transport factor 2 family protein [Virgibacillus necropolis]|uniref:hypothetical protein n=1 Tax=Virgibacillus necropolis TaxID=163877 RepID=UPI0038508D24
MESLLKKVEHFHQLQNNGRAAEMNQLVSDDFFASFSLGHDSSFHTYNANEYRSGNLQAEKIYEGKRPRWEYCILGSGIRSDNEFVVSAHIDFYLDHELIKRAFCTEVYRKEQEKWKLLRQYMEKYD